MTFGINYFESQKTEICQNAFFICVPAGLQLLESSRKSKKHSSDGDFLLGKNVLKDGVYEQKINEKIKPVIQVHD
jgi:hypothetical protein